jgi:hypothetical protein
MIVCCVKDINIPKSSKGTSINLDLSNYKDCSSFCLGQAAIYNDLNYDVIIKNVDTDFLKKLYEEKINFIYYDYVTNKVITNGVSPRDSTYETFIWGINKNQFEEASCYTENKINICLNNKDNMYYLNIDDNSSDTDVNELYNSLWTWYKSSIYFYREHNLTLKTITLADIYDNINFSSADTIKELIYKFELYIQIIKFSKKQC